MHSCKLITNLRAKKLLCHCAQVAKNFRCCNDRLCFFCNVIGSWKITHRQQSMLMKPEGSVGCHQTLSSQVGSGHETIIYVDKPLVFLCGLQCKNKLVVSTTKWLSWLQTSWRTNETTRGESFPPSIILHYYLADNSNHPIFVKIIIFFEGQL